MTTSKRVLGPLLVASVIAFSATTVMGCAAENAEGVDEGSSAATAGQAAPSKAIAFDYRHVQLGGMAQRRVTLSSGIAGITKTLQPDERGVDVETPSLKLNDLVADWGALTVPSSVNDMKTVAVHWKLAGVLQTSSRWTSLRTFQSDVTSIINALSAASGGQCKGNDWHLATTGKPNAPDFVCGTMANGAATLGAARVTVPVQAVDNACSLKYGADWTGGRVDASTVRITFRYNGHETTAGGRWATADFGFWADDDNNAATNSVFCQPGTGRNQCNNINRPLTSAGQSATYEAKDLAGRKVVFWNNDMSCKFGPF